MKKTFRFLSMAALALVGAMMTGCSSDEDFSNPQQPENKNNLVTLTTTVSLDGSATTRALSIEGNKGVKTFAVGEQVALAYWNTSINQWDKAVSQALTDDDISAGGKTATLTFTLNNPEENGPVEYCYPAAMANDYGQADYTKLATQTGGTLASLAANYDLAKGNGNLDGLKLPAVTLINQVAILAITLKNSDGSSDITSSITGLTVGDGTNTYAVTRETGAGPIYVAISPVIGATITVTATDGSKNYTKTLTGKTYAASSGYNVSWRMTEAAIPGVLNGQFSVSDTKQVYFSKGNLQYVSGTWSFFDHQYDCYDTYSADAWDKFGWSTSSTTYGMSTSEDNSDYSGDFVDWGTVPGIGEGWYTLSKDEWYYLFKTRSDAANKYGWATVNGVPGIIILPDGAFVDPNKNKGSNAFVDSTTPGWDANEYTEENWALMEAAGAVFLPAAGYRPGASVIDVGGYGYYWSSSAGGVISAYYVNFCGNFYSSYLFADSDFSRFCGLPVRLVRQVK